MTQVLHALLVLLAVPALLASAYLAVLALASLAARPLKVTRPYLRFTFLVPAHNEARGLLRTLDSLHNVAWPPSMARVHVVADNCTDATARIARSVGAVVTERHDVLNLGKGFALAAGVRECLADPFADAVVVIDADSTVDASFLAVMQAHLMRGASVVQSRYGVLNASQGWRPRLMTVALALFHDVRSRGREVLGLSTGLRGNGMCFTREVLVAHPPQSTSLVEDVEQGISLGLAGVLVHHAMETRVLGEMPVSSAAATSQRLRWEVGRAQLRRHWMRQLLRAAWAQKSRVLADLAADLAMPSLTSLVLGTVVGLVLSVAVAVSGPPVALVMWGSACALLALYITRGVQLSGAGWRAWLDLGAAPLFMAWKVALGLRRRVPAPGVWTRTARAGEKP